MVDNYYTQREKKNIENLRRILDELPRFVYEFFVGIQLRTSSLTRLNYAYDLRIFFDYLSRYVFKKPVQNIVLADINSLSAFDLECYLDYLTSYEFSGQKYSCSERGKERKLSSIRSFFKYYYKKEKLDGNVASKVDMPKIHEKPIIRLEPDEIARLLDQLESENIDGMTARQNQYLRHTKTRDLAIITLFLGTGIRISELVGLNIEDIDFAGNSFRVTRKGGGQVILYFSDEIAKPLRFYLDSLQDEIDNTTEFGKKIKESPALFFSLQGIRISVRAVQDLVKKYARLITPLKKITPHKLRSTFGTELYRNTRDIYVVADVLGHKDINTTKKHYADISDEIRRNAAKSIVLRDKDKRD